MKKFVTRISAILFTCVVFVSSNSAFAAAEFSGYTKITHISVGSAGDVYIVTAAAEKNPGNCVVTTTYRLPADHPAKKEYLALLMTAWVSGEDAGFYISDQCAGNYPRLLTITGKAS